MYLQIKVLSYLFLIYVNKIVVAYKTKCMMAQLLEPKSKQTVEQATNISVSQ